MHSSLAAQSGTNVLTPESWAAATGLARVIAQLAKVVNVVLDCGNRDGLGRIQRADLKEFSIVVDDLDRHQGVDIAAAMGEELWLKVVEVHSIAVRQLLQLTEEGSSRVNRVEIVLGCVLFIFIKTNALKAGGSASGSRLALGLLQTDAFQCYSGLLAAWTGLPGNVLEPKLRLMAQFSLIFSSIAQLTVSDTPLTPTDHTGTALYEACLEALSRSHLLEHASKALLTALTSSDGQLPVDQARNIRVGVMETCGCIVSALHGIAGKQGLLDSCWAQPIGADTPPPAEESVAQRLLPQVRAVLSQPCLQYLLGREIVASRLRITGSGEGPRFGLPDVMLPELVGRDPQAPVTRALTDRLLSRLGAASLVWHLVLPTAGQSGAVPPADPQPDVPVLRYRPVNIFDMVLEALLRVADASVPVEHLPGGSQLTLVEPAMLLVRLTMRVRPRNLLLRLARLWQALSRLLMRPAVRLQYSEHRPLQLIGGLLRLDLLLNGQLETAAVAAAAAVAADGDPGGADGQAGVAAAAAAAAGCSFNLRCALDAGLLRAVEQLLRGWGRADPVNKGETSCLCAVNHLLRWPCVWPAVLAHGSVREVASLTVTIRRLGEVFKDRGFKAMKDPHSNEPNEHQDAEVVVTAYMVALLEQMAVVLLTPGGEKPLALNEALESGGQPVSSEGLARLGGGPTPGTPAAVQQRALAVFAVSQWLPNAVWLARVVDTWFSVAMGKAALRWVLEAALQCLVARDRSEAEWVEAQAAALSGSGSIDPNPAGPQPARQRPCGPGAVAYVAWVTFLMVGVDMLAWIHKYLVQLRGQEAAYEGGEAAAGEDGDGEDFAGLNPAALLPLVFDVLEVLSVAVPRSVRMCVKPGPAAQPARPVALEAAADVATAVAAGPKVAAAAEPSQPSPASAAPPASGLSARFNLDRELVLDAQLQGLLVQHGRRELLALLEAWAAADDTLGGAVDGQDFGEPSEAPAVGEAPEREAPQLAALRSAVAAKHNLAHLPELPSPYAAAEVVDAAGIKLCANPTCSNLEGNSEAELSGRKVCRFCKTVSYCSGDCQLKHWKDQHCKECQPQKQPGTSGAATPPVLQTAPASSKLERPPLVSMQQAVTTAPMEQAAPTNPTQEQPAPTQQAAPATPTQQSVPPPPVPQESASVCAAVPRSAAAQTPEGELVAPEVVPAQPATSLWVEEPVPLQPLAQPSPQALPSAPQPGASAGAQPGPSTAPQPGVPLPSPQPAAAGISSASGISKVCANPGCGKASLPGWSCVRCRGVSYCSGTCRFHHQAQHQAECAGAAGQPQPGMAGGAVLFGSVRSLGASQHGSPQRDVN